MQAHADGKPIQVNSTPEWRGITKDYETWDWSKYDYRIKPTTVLRPWTSDEVPLGVWMRNKSVQYDRWIIVHLQYSSHNREEWLDKYEHSTDGGVTWKPCGVVEDKL